MIQILMIDDDIKLVSLVREYLEPQGFQLNAAHDGKSGLALASAPGSELVILDLMLPEMDGLEVCRRLRAISAVPILMLTARGDETDRIVGLELGADDYLAKPFNPRELLARIRAILRRSQANPSVGSLQEGALQLDRLIVDPASRSVRLDGAVVDFTSAEFDLLLALGRNAGRVMTRNQLLEAVHGDGWAAYDRSVDVHISRIRQKVETDPRQPSLIKTIRGVGYQLACSPAP